jgi:serine/threonine protein kinase
MANNALTYEQIEKDLSHQYKIDGMLGEGAYGKVFKAKCKDDGEVYAIKVLPANKDRKRYHKRELEALVKLNSLGEAKRNFVRYFISRIVPVGGVKTLCIQMELCSGDLKMFVYKNRKFGPQITQAQGPRFYQQVFQQVLNGLVIIHAIGWVHRDIHPGNILIVNPNPKRIGDIHVKIGDFGLARCIVNMEMKFGESPGMSLYPLLEQCTPGLDSIYTAPEFKTTNYDEKVDLYSAGVLLYFISRYPEENDNEWTTELKDLMQGKSDINKRLFYQDDKKLGSLITDLLRTKPDERPSASKAKEYMFPEATDSTDANKVQKTKFFARKENEQEWRMCFLTNLTFSALKAEVERRTGVNAKKLRQEDINNGKVIHIIIDNDEVVECIFQDAAQNKSCVKVVVKADDINTETALISSGDASMETV